MILFDEQMRGREWEINRLTAPCRNLLTHIVEWCEHKDFHVYITCVHRTRSEQEAICAKLKVPYYDSVHQVWRGFDFRVFPDEQFNAWLDKFANETFSYDPARPQLKSLLRHEGTGDHFHGQTHK